MFGTSGIRGRVGTEMTAEVALSVGRAVASEGNRTVVVGRDVRQSGRMLVDALTAGLRECGADVLEVGVESTPTVARAVNLLDADAGVVVTASHNPPPDNGIKLWTRSGKAFGPDRRDAIERRLRDGEFDPVAWDELGVRRRCDRTREAHAERIVEAVDIDGRPDVVVDLGNGAGAITPATLADLGCRVRTLNGQQDGAFPGRPSEPTEETLETLAALVERADADLGIAHDGDADRMLAVDETGRFVPKDALLAIFARTVASDGDRIAAPVDTSLAVDDAVSEVGASVTRTRVGDVFVAERATESDVVFGGEPSGAWIWPEETLCPDGPLAAAKLVELVDERGSLSALVEEIDRYPIERTSVSAAEKGAVVDDLRGRVDDRYDDVDTLDGVRVEVEDGWFLIRASGTEPLIRVTAESRTDSGLERVFDEATTLVSETIDRRT
ncbi:phosphoglucosamine mutase [Natrarchaeobius sp. A-rgal3]|uniref:phosphoglucosamine mutase n=1 Tax=Natrarchaeobius versutus TaxID=1679078 RepID=UPI0035105F4D